MFKTFNREKEGSRNPLREATPGADTENKTTVQKSTLDWIKMFMLKKGHESGSVEISGT